MESVQIASTKLIRVFSSRSTIFVYFNRNNDFFLCSTSFLLSCAPPILNKSAHTHTHSYIQRLFLLPFFSLLPHSFFFYIADYFFSPLSRFCYFSSTKANNRKNERERETEKPGDDEFANTSHHTTHT